MTMTRTSGSAVGRVDGLGRAPGRSSPDSALSLAGRLSVSRTPHGVRAVSRTGSSAVIVAGPSRTTSASTAIAPPAVAMTGLRSTSRMSGRSSPSWPSATSIATTAARSTGGRPRTPRRRRAPRRSSSIASAVCRVERREPDRDVVEDLGQDPAETDQHGRPELRVAAQAEDQLEARRGHRLDQQPADREAVAPARSRAAGQRPRRRRHRRRAARARPRRARSCGRARRRRA